MPSLAILEPDPPHTGSIAEQFAASLPKSLEDVLSTMFFADISGEAADSFDPDAPFFCAVVNFHGSINGQLGMAVPMDVAVNLAGDFYGGDEALEDRAVEYAVCELANMVCGSTLSRIAPHSHVTLTHPQLVAEPFLPGSDVRLFALIDGVVALSYRLQSE